MAGKKILVVDDEHYIRRLIQVNLEASGYQVVTASDGRECLEKVRTEKPDLVILDILMPVMDGFEALKTLRSDKANEDLPILILSIKASDSDVFKAYHAAADMYLTKPFKPAELLVFVERALAGRTVAVPLH